MTSPWAGRSAPRCSSAPTAAPPCRRSSSTTAMSAAATTCTRSSADGRLDPHAERRMKIALFQAQTGIDPEANAAELVRRVDGGRRGRRGDAVHARDERPARPRPGARRRRICAPRPTIRCSPRSARRPRQAGIWVHLGSLALLARGRRQARQSRLRHRRRGRDPRPLRQDAPVRRRPADRRELARIGLLSGRRAAGAGRDAARPARPFDLLRSALRRPLCGAERRRRDHLQHPRRLHRADRRGALARADARPRDRGRRLRRRRRPGRPA